MTFLRFTFFEAKNSPNQKWFIKKWLERYVFDSVSEV